MSLPILIAIGGNSLIRAGQRGTIAEQMENAAITCGYIAALVERGHQVLLTHGNGPQVGAQLLRSELSAAQVYPMPLDTCDASTQGELGYILQNALRTALAARGLKRTVVTILTQVVVDPKDAAFAHPTKPVGPFYSRETAERRKQELGWDIVEDAARGYRRVVPSPKPIDIVELDAIAACLRQDMLVIAAGGGGIPVVRNNSDYCGVEAVIDKDLASALLAKELGLKVMVISTDADRVYLNFKKPNQTSVDRLTVSEAARFLSEGQFPPGSMGPKIEAAVDFLANGGETVVITNFHYIVEALEGRAGTRITRDPER